MKKMLPLVLVLCLIFPILAAIAEDAAAPQVGTPQVTSQSITEDGRLITLCAANRSPNKPRGENQSPQLSFAPVEGATCYAIYMFDITANWLHMAVVGVTETELPLGAYTDSKQYIGPYPPKGTGDHRYVIEVFALKSIPDKVAGKMNASNKYDKIVASLDLAGGQEGNILWRGTIECLYRNGDNTVIE